MFVKPAVKDRIAGIRPEDEIWNSSVDMLGTDENKWFMRNAVHAMHSSAIELVRTF